MKTLRFKTRDHPTAEGRAPQLGDQQWVVTLPLEDGDQLCLLVGRAGRDAIAEVMAQEDAKDAEAANKGKDKSTTMYLYSFVLYPANTTRLSVSSLKVFELAKTRVEMILSETSFCRMRQEIARDQLVLREIERVPYYPPVPVE